MVAGWKSVATWRKFVTPGLDRDQSRRAAAEFNNGLQLTRSARCAPSPSDWGQSLRAALAAEAGCWTVRGTDRMRICASALRGPRKPLVGGPNQTAKQEARRGRGLSPSARLPGCSLGHLPGAVGRASGIPSQSPLRLLVRFGSTTQGGSTGRDSRPIWARPSNKGMNPARSTQTIVGPRGLFQCSTGYWR